VCVHLIDSFHTSDSARFVSAMLLSLSAMLMMALPHVNVLSKIDLLGQYGDPRRCFLLITFVDTPPPLFVALPLEYYLHLPRIKPLIDSLGSEPGVGRFKKLNRRLASLVQDFALVGFHTLCITVCRQRASLDNLLSQGQSKRGCSTWDHRQSQRLHLWSVFRGQ